MRPLALAALADALGAYALGSAAIERRAARRLARTLAHARREVPFHRARLAGVRDLGDAPLSRPADLRAASPEQLLARGVDPTRCRRDRTSGSAGARVDVYLDAGDQVRADAVWIRSYLAMGLRPHHRRVRLRDPDPTTAPRPPSWRRRAGLPMPVEVSSRAPLDGQVAALAAARPHVVHGSPTELARVAAELARHGATLGASLVVAGGEPLHEADRALVEAAFGVRPRGVYGCTEIGFVSFECALGLHHVNADAVWCEVLSDGSDGRANLVLTTLVRRAMPFVRLMTPDVVRPERRCSCGSPLPVLGRVLGPEHRFLRLPDGRAVDEGAVRAALADLDRGRGISVAQRARGVLEVRVDPPLFAREGLGERVRERLRALTCGALEVEVRAAPEEPRAPGAKRALVDAREVLDA